MPGQINRGSILGELIYNLVLSPNIKTILEIGTWNGLGSTKCVIDGLSKKSYYRFISIESSPKMFEDAVKNIGQVPGFDLILGRLIEIKDIPEFTLNETQAGWLRDDINNYSKVPNVLDRIPEELDLIIFDGGEFTSELEFNLISDRATHIILDDTSDICFKFKNIRRKLRENKTDFNIINDNINDRNGWIYARRR